eukprot:310812-Heterocapsa_arctica.AAC.1
MLRNNCKLGPRGHRAGGVEAEEQPQRTKRSIMPEEGNYNRKDNTRGNYNTLAFGVALSHRLRRRTGTYQLLLTQAIL